MNILGEDMPVPKRKTSKARRDQRQSCKFIRPQSIAGCSNCESPNLPHQVCKDCGFYKGRKVLATKIERALKRGEERKVLAEKRAKHAQTAQPEAGEADKNV